MQISVTDAVMQDLEERRQKGILTYGRELTTFNGRKALQDLYEELLDAACYIKQAMLEEQWGEKLS